MGGGGGGTSSPVASTCFAGLRQRAARRHPCRRKSQQRLLAPPNGAALAAPPPSPLAGASAQGDVGGRWRGRAPAHVARRPAHGAAQRRAVRRPQCAAPVQGGQGGRGRRGLSRAGGWRTDGRHEGCGTGRGGLRGRARSASVTSAASGVNAHDPVVRRVASSLQVTMPESWEEEIKKAPAAKEDGYVDYAGGWWLFLAGQDCCALSSGGGGGHGRPAGGQTAPALCGCRMQPWCARWRTWRPRSLPRSTLTSWWRSTAGAEAGSSLNCAGSCSPAGAWWRRPSGGAPHWAVQLALDAAASR